MLPFHGTLNSATTAFCDGMAEDIRALTEMSDLSSGDGAFALHFILAMNPWGSSRVDPIRHPLSYALGRVWDHINVPSHLLTGSCNSWASFSERHVIDIFSAWSDAGPLFGPAPDPN